jgi:hypothetical protein
MDGPIGQGIPLVLSGPPRSGTTLFSALLDGHSEINWFIDEAFYFEHLHVLGRENFERFVKAGMLAPQGLIEGLRDRSLMPPTHVPPVDFPSLRYAWSEERFRNAIAHGTAGSPRELWALLRDAYIAGFGYAPRRYVSIKAADYGRSVFGALDYFAEARGVIIVREPIAALASLKAYRQKRNAKLLTWPTLVQAVVDMNRLAAEVDRLDRERLRIVRYEDFAEAPEPTMRSICDWLGVRFEPTLLEPSMMGQPWSNNSSFSAGESGVASLPQRRAATLADAERDYALWALGPFRKRFGYV